MVEQGENGVGTGPARGGNGDGTADARPDPILTARPQDLRVAEERLQAIAPLLQDHPSFDPSATLASQSIKTGKSVRAIYIWLRRYEAAGRAGLIDRPRSDKGRMRRGVPKELQEFAVATCLQLCRISGIDKPAYTEVWRRVELQAKIRGLPVPSRHAVRRLLQAIPRAERIYAAKGDEGFNKEVVPRPPVHRADAPNQRWVSDHQLTDLFVLYEGRRRRMWITVIMDLFDQTVLGFCLGPQANSDSICLALRMAILPKAEDPEGRLCGLPSQFLTDRGLDYLGKQVATALHELQIAHVPVTGRSPWTKGPGESFFRILTEQFIRYILGHSGNKPTAKPLPVKVDELLTLEDLNRRMRQWILVVYNNMAFHRRRVHGKQITRLDLRRSVPFVPRLPGREELVHLLMRRASAQVGKGGIRFGGMFTYWADELAPFAMERATVEVRYDPADMAQIVVYHEDRFYCYAYDAKASAAKATAADARQRLKKQREYLGAVKTSVDPRLKAAMDGRVYLDQLAADRVGQAKAAAGAQAGRRKPVHVLLPKEASAVRGQRPRAAHRSWDPFEPK